MSCRGQPIAKDEMGYIANEMGHVAKDEMGYDAKDEMGYVAKDETGYVAKESIANFRRPLSGEATMGPVRFEAFQ